jgi:uncharacterized protein YbjQ (UPF0145 family)
MKECPKCQFENSDNANYCTACGSVLAHSGGSSRPAGTTMAGTVAHSMVSTTFEVLGHRVVKNLGLVRGIVVRSRSIVGTVGASLQTLVGGDISLFTELCEKTRNDAFERMLQHAAELGANAVIGVRYDATEIMNGVTEVLAYGTAVIVQPVS